MTPAAVSGLPKALQGSHLLCHAHVRCPLQVLGCLVLAGSQVLLLCQQRSKLLQLLLLGCSVGDDCSSAVQPLRCPVCHLTRCPQAACLGPTLFLRQLGSFRLLLSCQRIRLWQATSGSSAACCRPARVTGGLLPPHLSCASQGRPYRLHRPQLGRDRACRTSLLRSYQSA